MINARQYLAYRHYIKVTPHSGPALGVWKENVSDADIGAGFPWNPIRSSFFSSQFDIPNGIKYVMFKQFINNNATIMDG
jgi:hypothetical protein